MTSGVFAVRSAERYAYETAFTVQGPPAVVSATEPVPVSNVVMLAVTVEIPLGGLPASVAFA